MTDRKQVDLDTVFYQFPAAGVALLTLNRPEFANGVVPELAGDLQAALDDLEGDSDIRALVFTGAGRQFCAGADLTAMQAYLRDVQPVTHEPFNARVLYPVTQRLVTSRLPIIAAINGGATAGGLDLAMACDIRIASTRAKLGETYVRLGLPPGNGGAYFLPRLVGSGTAAELFLTGDLVDANRALQIGLVNRVVEPDGLIDEAVTLAARIARHPRRAVEATKQALRASWGQDLQTAITSGFWAVAALQHSEELREGVAAALDKRPPRYDRPVAGS
ncbi:enoyl-CoA hydratase/isomerase family protein [Frankia gtarii]|uniref:enoyl-CoA hydratase/isomerase family protein n=1 Tax=Frankia gtarii TaxID=2950102 RepID=UPI0021C07AD7|nr:enoyl-CoA hydratase-related protein [Frankia gtarii]